MITLEVPGRRSGVVRRTTLVQAVCDGERYVVALAGESQSVRNVRAAGGRVVLGRRERRAARLATTPGHVAYFRGKDRVLITGDAVLTVNLNSVRDLLLTSTGSPARRTSSTWDWPTAKQSVAALAQAPAWTLLACGHGRPITGHLRRVILERSTASW